MDNIYVLNYLINRQVGRKRGKMVILFVDLKTAFDKVDRRVLVEMMRREGILEGLVERVEEILRETRSRVKIRREMGESFWAEKGVRQGCPLNPLLFSIMLADLEEEMRRGRWGD